MTADRLARALRRYFPYAAAVLLVALAVIGLTWRPATSSSSHRADYVVIAGVAGLRWDDVDPVNTPTMWAMAQRGSIGALSVQSARSTTCPADGWITLGAGNYARRPPSLVDGRCETTLAQPTSPDNIGAVVGDQEQRVADNRSLSSGAEPGALAEAVRCTVAVGSGAALAAARPFGRVDRYAATLPTSPTPLLGACTLSIVDLGAVDGATPEARAIQAHAADQTLARVLAARPPRSLVLVAGISDTDTTSHLHVAIADGPGYNGGWLTSASTGRSAYLQLVDLAPTALAALAQPLPAKLMVGAQAQRVEGRPSNTAAAVAHLADADREVSLQQRVGGWFYGLLVPVQIALLIVAVPLLRRARRSAEPHGPPPVSPRLVRYVEALLVAVALTIPVAILTDIVPWWRSSYPGATFAGVAVALAAVVTTVVFTGPWRTGALGPLAATAAFCASVVALDVLTGSSLQFNGVAGYSSATGGRYAGVGAAGLGVFIVGVLLLAGCLAQRVKVRRWRPAVVAGVVALGVIVIASPYLGADAGGAVALTAGGCVAAAVSTGGWLSFTRLGWATLAGLVVLFGFAAMDLTRPVSQRGSLGQFITQFHDGTAGPSVHRIAVDDVVATVSNPVSLFVVVAILFNLMVLFRPWGGLLRLFGLYPAVRGAMTAMGVASVLAGLLDGVGFTTAGAAASVALPLVTLAALRVLDHADDRTVAHALSAPPRGNDDGYDPPILDSEPPVPGVAPAEAPDTPPAAPAEAATT
ncbi:MAG TPA: hypothetical protein VKB69_07840 [Micromonosporaceae bacterium]|nr:hypothetical protein [Micromonosporaceae bacterium]